MSSFHTQSTDLQPPSDIRADFGQVSGVLLGLVLFGLAYNAFVAWMRSRGYDEGFLSLLVAGGVSITLLGMALISTDAALIALACFVCSGLPMIIGSITRYIRRRAALQRSIAEDARK